MPVGGNAPPESFGSTLPSTFPIFRLTWTTRSMLKCLVAFAEDTKNDTFDIGGRSPEKFPRKLLWKTYIKSIASSSPFR